MVCALVEQSCLYNSFTPPGSGNVFIDMANAVITNVEVQGIEVAVGLQDHLDWASVAVAGISAGVTTAVSKALPDSGTLVDGVQTKAASSFNRPISGAVDGIVNAVHDIARAFDSINPLLAPLVSINHAVMGTVDTAIRNVETNIRADGILIHMDRFLIATTIAFALSAAGAAHAADPVKGKGIFSGQCGICHAANASASPVC